MTQESVAAPLPLFGMETGLRFAAQFLFFGAVFMIAADAGAGKEESGRGKKKALPFLTATYKIKGYAKQILATGGNELWH